MTRNESTKEGQVNSMSVLSKEGNVPRKKKIKLNIPAGTTLCPKCEGIGCKMCGGKGYYDPYKEDQRIKQHRLIL